MNFSLKCVECGEDIDSLYVEYSEGNIRLSRCSKCTSVADKYIEYETILVLIDVILHRKQAFRHILFNRHQLDGAKNSMRWMLLGILAINTLLKFIVLHDLVYHSWPVIPLVLHLFISSLLEHIGFCLFVGFVLMCRHDIPFPNHSMYGKYYRRLYFAISFPEYFKLIAILLQVFDSEPELLTLFGAFLLSIACYSVHCFTNKSLIRIIPIVIMGAVTKLCIRRFWYDNESIFIQGIIM